MFEKLFKLKEHKTNARTEIIAGITTFMTMAYILVVNPLMLGEAGMDVPGVFAATALSAAVATLVMALVANLPFALAPGMGLNAFFVYTVVFTMGYSWQTALAAVFIEGIIFLILTFLNVREAILNCIPKSIKHGISVGIGLFIAFIGLTNNQVGIIVHQEYSTIIQVGDILHGAALLAIIGILITGILVSRKVKGGLLIGIFVTALIGIPMGVTDLSTFDSGAMFKMPSLSEVFLKFDFSEIFSLKFLTVLFTFLFVDMFDTVGTLIGVSDKAGFLNEKGELPGAKNALLADAVGTTVGAMLGTSTVTTYIESASGVAEGGKTGLTSFTTAIMFLVALFISPVFLVIPAAATTPVLVIVGMFMMSPIAKIDWEDYTEALPAFLTIVMMPWAYSISHGIAFGVMSYAIVKALSGKAKEVSVLTYILAGIFVIGFLTGALHVG